MNKIYFENGLGRVDMFFSGTAPVRVTALSGLLPPKRSYNTVVFAQRDGQKTLSSVTNARTIIISGDINFSHREDLERIIKVFGEAGELVLDFKDKKRKIYCNQVELEEGKRRGNYLSFILSLTADEVYFTDMEETVVPVYERKKLIQSEIEFPCMFSSKTTGAIAHIYGEVNVLPVIKIYNLCDDGTENTEGILIENVTTNQKIKLNYNMKQNEEVVVDVKNRKIISSLNGNITHTISDDTFLNKFWLKPGENQVEVSHGNEKEEYLVILSYLSSYREGIY